MRTDIIDRRQEIENWIASRRPKAFMCRELQCKPSTLNSYLQKLNLSYAGNMGGKGYKQCPTRKGARTYLRKGTLISSYKSKLLVETWLVL